ncbi:MAG: cation-translocating P-type ATPase [Candidatus Buchananbacteria bacterium]
MQNQGLTTIQAKQQQLKFGSNALPEKGSRPAYLIFFSQFNSPIIFVLLTVTLFSSIFGEYVDAGLIALVIIIDVIMGFYQEYKAEKTMANLKKIIKQTSSVWRDGIIKVIESKDLVPGDLIILGSGERIPADGYLVEGSNLFVNEAILTGEDEAVQKISDGKQDKLFMGTIISSGRGQMIVEKIGLETEVGRIGQSLAEIKEEKTPLQKKLTHFTKTLTGFIIVLSSIIFIIGLLAQKNIWETIRLSVILAVSAIPEGLPIGVTVILTLGVSRILKKNGLVKKLISIETLGSTSVICTDKTGTLTEGIMKVSKTSLAEKEPALSALLLANVPKSGLEVALWEYAKKECQEKYLNQQSKAKRIFEDPFDSEKKYSLNVIEVDKKSTGYIIGAPEIVLSFCQNHTLEQQKIISELEKWTSQGLRVIGLAYKIEGKLSEPDNYIWAGLVGIIDPIRKEVKETISLAQKAGIQVKIVTGDYLKTAQKVAATLGLKTASKNLMEGRELETISESELNKRIKDITVFARVTPHQKLKIIHALQNNGEIVAMTGDGINDTPALKKADIGVAVGSATDVAKETADLILLDNNFKTIIAACEEGRLIFSNIKKTIGYMISNSFATIILILGTVIFNLPYPIAIVQILWIQLICDGPPDLLLAFEPKEEGLMDAKPKKFIQDEILNTWMKTIIAMISISVGLMTLILFAYLYKTTNDLKLARTAVFLALGSVSIIYVISFKNLSHSILKTKNFFKNIYLFFGIIYGFILLAISLYVPWIRELLDLKMIEWPLILIILSIGILITIMIEIAKYFNFSKN